jgi:hypothetical protein
VYIHTHPISKIPFYVGKGKGKRYISSGHRFKAHKTHLKNLLSLGYSMNTISEIHKNGLTEQDAFNLEIELIAKYGRKCDGTGTLLNMTKGGPGGSIYGLSERWKKERVGTGNPSFGIKRTRETRELQSLVHKTRLKDPFKRKEYRERFIKLAKKEAQRAIGTKWWTNGTSNMRAFECPGQNWILGFKTKPYERLPIYDNGHKHPKCQKVMIDKTIYYSLREAARKTGISKYLILQKINKKVKGFEFV